MKTTALVTSLVLGSLALVVPASAQCEVQVFDLPGGSFNEHFGAAIAADGDWVAVGNTGTPSVDGTVRMYRQEDPGTPSDPSDDRWVFHQIIPEAVGDHPNALSMRGNRIAIGSPSTSCGAFVCGAVHIYELVDGEEPGSIADDTWTFVQTLQPSDGALQDDFGAGVALGPDFVLVGSPRSDSPSADSGSVYVFRLDDAGTPLVPGDDEWVEHQELVPSNRLPLAGFGQSIDIDGPWSVAAGDGLFTVHRRDDAGTALDNSDDVWIQQLQVGNASLVSAGPSVAIEGDFVVVEDYFETFGLDYRVALFGRDDASTPADLADDTWTLFGEIQSFDGVTLGPTALRMHDGQLVVGELEGAVPRSLHLFELDDGGTATPFDDAWTETHRMRGASTAAGTGFGSVVAMSDRGTFAGAKDQVTGAAWAFARDATLCSDQAELSLSGGGSEPLRLDAGVERAGDLHWVLGSVTGTSPPILFGTVALPLAPDAYTSLILKKPFLGAFGSFLGFLSVEGRATASFNLPAGVDASLAGLVLYHAYLTTEVLGDVDFASNAVSLRVVP